MRCTPIVALNVNEMSRYYHIWIFAHVDGMPGVKMLLFSHTVVEVVVHVAHLHVYLYLYLYL